MSAICRAKKLQFVGLVAVVLCFTPFLAVSQSGSRVQKLADIEFDAIAEMSGLAVSRRYEDVIWMHNDSGDEPRLFATNFQGRVIIPSFLRNFYHGEEAESGKQPWPGLSIATAANIDWEDIAVDDDFIYIADVVRAFALAVEKVIASGIYNLGTGVATPVLEIVEAAERVIGGSTTISKVLESRTPTSEDKVGIWAGNRWSKENLGWEPETTLEEGIRKIWKWKQ